MKLRSILGAAVLVASVVGAAHAADRHVLINNKASSVMTKFYASNTGTDNWEENILGSDALAPGDNVNVNINDGTGACHFDFKAEFKDGSSAIKHDVNVCDISQFDFTD